MTLWFIHDNQGNTTGVFIPIEEWQILKTKYFDLQIEEAKNFIEPNPVRNKQAAACSGDTICHLRLQEQSTPDSLHR